MPDGGRVEVSPPGAQVGYLTQERERPHNESVEAYLQRRTGTADAEAALEKAVQRLADGDMSEDAQAVYAHALERFNRADPGGFEARAAETLASLGGTAALLSARYGRVVRWRGGPRRVGRHDALALRHNPARRADERPGLRRAWNTSSNWSWLCPAA